LRQHADNPVAWWEWGTAAFAEARRRNVPVLLSVGYASCHWCHVMAHESFEDADTAAQLNADFVAIKVDREERPDIDAIYMTATQALTGSGGWPMTCFLTPDGDPFYAGTYFPPEPRNGMPSFRQVLAAVTEAWRHDPGEVRAAGRRIAERLRAAMTVQPATDAAAGPPPGDGALAQPLADGGQPARRGPDIPASDAAALDSARDDLLAELDRTRGGFGSAPKFPPPMAMEFLLRHHERTGDRAALDAVTLTVDAMARGGIYDQLAGGFARYSVDGRWHVPHFEKMLTDNAQLVRVYAHHARVTGSELSGRVARESGEFLLREMRATSGIFIASLDADAAGVEGLTYRWPVAELTAAVRAATERSGRGAEHGDPAASLADALAVFGVDPGRPDPEGEVLRRVREPVDPALFKAVRAALMEVRALRPQPGRDEIATLAGNGLTITALAEAGALLGLTAWVAAAEEAAVTMVEVCRRADGWRRSVFRGETSAVRAGLADHAAIAAGLAALYQATGRVRWLDLARDTAAEMVGLFRDPAGAWFDAAAEPNGGADGADSAGGVPVSNRVAAAPTIMRPSDPTDGAVPSGRSAAADALLTVSALTGDARMRGHAEEILAAAAPLARRFPRSAAWYLAAAEAMAAGPIQIVVAGPAGPERDHLAAVARRDAPGGAVLDVGVGDEPGRPLLEARAGIDGNPAAYVCRGFVCDRPVTSGADLARQLRRASAAVRMG
jgi:uncharacterized protein YyaL (SSP411 family)